MGSLGELRELSESPLQLRLHLVAHQKIKKATRKKFS